MSKYKLFITIYFVANINIVKSCLNNKEDFNLSDLYKSKLVNNTLSPSLVRFVH